MTNAAALGQTLPDHLAASGAGAGLQAVILAVADGCREIGRLVARGALAGVLGAGDARNVQGEDQQKLDVISNAIMIAAAERSGAVRAIASEEMEDIVPLAARDAEHLLLFDPLDGSSNIDVNVSIGTIFSVLRAPGGVGEVTAADFLQPGRAQIAAGYAVYGPQTGLVLTVGEGVSAFTLDPDTGEWRLTTAQVSIPRQTREFAINMSNQRHWAEPVRGYIQDCLDGKTGPRGKDFNMRWIASMVADVHRICNRGGVFLYPWDKREPDRAGKLRLMYEANPLGLVVERAGGLAITGPERILDLQPTQLHQRVSVVLGSAEEVEQVAGRFRRVG